MSGITKVDESKFKKFEQLTKGIIQTPLAPVFAFLTGR